VDADSPARLLLGINLFVHPLLFGDEGFQGVGHPLELLLVCIVVLVQALGEGVVHHVVAAGVPGCRFMDHGDDLPQEGDLLVLERGWRGGSGFLVVLGWSDVGKGFAWGCGAAAEVVVFHIYQESTLRADPLSWVPVCTCYNGVEASFVGYFS